MNKMETTTKFSWTNIAKTNLLCIVNEAGGTDSINWTIVSNKFKILHPSYKGKIESLKKQYQRIKNENVLTTSVTPQTVNKKFLWSDKSKADLLSIVSAVDQTKRINWSIVATKFKDVYPDYEGDNHSLRMRYVRIEKNTNEQTDFVFTKQQSMDLLRLVNLINVDGYPNWTKICYTFKRYHPNFTGSKEDLRRQYENENMKCFDESENHTAGSTDTANVWNEHFDTLLAQATGHAMHIRSAQIWDGRKKNVENLANLTVKVFKEFYKARHGVEFIGHDAVILKHFYDHKESIHSLTYVCDEELDSFANINAKKLEMYASKNHTLAFCKILGECCHNCGVIFPRTRNTASRKLLPNAINNTPRVENLVSNVPYVYYLDEKYITCLECYKNSDWYKDYAISTSKTRLEFPNELRNLSEYEQNQISLCGGFYTLHRKQNVQCKIFEHRQGEFNIGKKRDADYHNLFTTYFNIERPQKIESSENRIKTAIRWLRKNNHLFRVFLSNYETIYGYLMSCHNLHPEERILQISKGNLTDIVGKDASGLFVPADDVQIQSSIKPENHLFGVQHPLQDNLNKLKEIINVTYSDPDLEAKRWPHLFPEGIGSWKRNSSLKQQTYVKHRLLSIDERFRRNNEFMFFWYDRLIKERLLYFNNRQRTVNVSDLVESLHVKDVRKNTSKYGSVVPSSISGSKTYWRARSLDLLALTRDLGKPDLFVTLTQNDNWLELQDVCGEIRPEELNLLDKSIMQPAIGGKSVVKFPVETVVAFYKRLDMFMRSCIQNKNGPFGEVIDYWFRIEYQNRGALHCHMILWICEDTMPEDVVMAELPRCSSEKNAREKHQTFLAREYVRTFQIHTCKLKSCRKDINSKCKYGFPYEIQLNEKMNDSKMGYKYMRRHEDDKNVVPYNMYALMCWNGHINVQKVTPNGIEAYLCKYVSKPERSIDIKEMTSDTEKFLRARVVGILECCAHLMQFHQVGSSRKTLFLPCDFRPKQRMLKRRSHLPVDNESEDVYYQTLLDKYLVRPKELHNLTYVDMYRFYDVVSKNTRVANTQTFELTEDDSDNEFPTKCDETQYEFNKRVRKIKSQRISYYSNGYRYVERGKAAVPRWRFLMPFGTESEKYYEQRLLLNVPITEEELDENGYPFGDDNKTKTFVEECCLRGLVDSEETAKSALLGAIQRGFSVDRVLEIAKMFVDQSFVTNEYVDSIIIPWQESMPCVDNTQIEAGNEYGEELAKMLEMREKYDPYETYFNSMTESQKCVMEWVDQKFKKCDQILAIVSGGAGVGKSFITKALYSYFIEKKLVCILLATTGSAAHLISGTTVHYYLKIDIHGNKYMQPGTISAKIVEDTDVIILDEFSMLSSDLLDQLNECTKEYGKSKTSPFGGKHFFLIGDPCQLPAVNSSVFSNPLLSIFSILLLKETVRQKDEVFAGLLNRVRINSMTDEDKTILRNRYTNVSSIVCEDDMLIVAATRKKMQFYNHKFIAQVPGEPVVVQAKDYERDTNKEVSTSVRKKIRRYVKNLWDEKLIIKEGCIVRLLRNLDVQSGWVNSKRAKVFRVAKDGSYVILQDITNPSKQLPLTKIRQPFKLGANLYYRHQYPLVLGYATTVHAVQGTTVTGKYYVDLDRSFWESGQAFVALSRPKEISQLYLLNTHFEKVHLKSYYKDLLEWMRDVDEISILRKPRNFNDFPLIPVDDKNVSDVQVFPSVSFLERKPTMKERMCAKFKAPRKIIPIDCEVEKPNESRTINTFQQISPRMYRLADAFANACRNSSIIHNKIQFGIKFMNTLLEEINNTLHIHNVTDPLILVENGHVLSPSIVTKWDEQLFSTLHLFRKYFCQFRAELDLFANLVFTLEISKYTGQKLASGVSPLYRDAQKWQPVHTDGDGRCFYHAVSMNLSGNSTLSNALKILVSYGICNEFEIYDTIFSNLGSSASNVILKALSYNCWADMEIITAMSYIFQRPIRITSGLQELDVVHDRNYNPLESESNPIRIAHVKMSKFNAEPNHFVALLLDDTYVHVGDENEHLNHFDGSTKVLTIELPEDDVEMPDLYDSLTESL